MRPSSPATLRAAGCLALVLAAPLGAAADPGRAKKKADKVPCQHVCTVAVEDACCPSGDAGKPLPEVACNDLASCMAACDRGDAIACLHAGDLSSRAPPGKGRDNAQAYVFFDKGCRLGDCRSCWNGCSGSRGDYQGVPNFEAALARDQADCQAGDPNSCRKVATLHHEDGRYAGFEQRACDLGSAEACAAMVAAYSSPLNRSMPEFLGLPTTPDFIAKLEERACALGHVRSCLSVGYWRGRATIEGLAPERQLDEQWKRAADLLDPFCRRGEAGACRVLGTLRGEMNQKPLKPAAWDALLEVKYLDHACSMGDAEGCRLLGVAHLHAAGITGRAPQIKAGTPGIKAGTPRIKGDTRAAFAAFQRSCYLGSGRGCVAQSQLTSNRHDAQTLIDSACEHGERGYGGNIYTNAGLEELPQPLNCSYPRGARGPSRR